MHRGFTTPLVIAIMAFAVVSFLFLIDTSINQDGARKTVSPTLVKNHNTNNGVVKFNTNETVITEYVDQFTNRDSNANTNATSSSTAGWKTYTNTQLKYSIMYPSDWGIGLETDKQTTISGEGGGTPFSAPSVSITTSEPDQLSSCLLKEETVTVLGESRLRQTQGCGYAGSNIATFIKKENTYYSVSWTEDVPAAYPTYETMLTTFSLLD